MTFTETFPERIAIRCDATPQIGVGHVVRCLALGQELRARGLDVVLWGDIDGLDWLTGLVEASGLRRLPATGEVADQLRQADDEQFVGVVLDGYHLSPTLGGALRAAGYVVLALVDGEFGAAQQADLYVDQNLGATPHQGGPTGSRCLTGPDFTLLRDSVLQRRRAPDLLSPGRLSEIRSVLAVFGGSDPAGAAPVVVPALLSTDAALDVTVVSSNPRTADRLAALRLSSQQRLRVIPPQPDLAGLAAASDLTISASGTTVWELLAMGVPTAVVCVVDNQRLGYRALLAAEVATGLGELTSFDTAAATSALAALIENPPRATGLALKGQRLIDGDGRRRVADALLAMFVGRDGRAG
ncbi:UDP-2,4-diacetamido-2,4,6-trideoxy-beta-L-altropyranose hydrolase [Flexivirga endophytica]|uniref:UDP-2,4-diacetamido-2,4, 6-trideoxy-beta-L-altropyranose hydrolase n=1 Tax=Flexivirga endophytica TaxID=1849103 RepID=A0A916WW64_9MICO|nr:spore coat protein [Flexivirga endophytica]GGB38815.1 UDP-2,4-diacetamido-2,4,6-trideoxy-beta-L-altropyranose hydrolase [Flexivirga endophytica]GHB46797.1 UDP-2,4-diacetamido-2,4,6-trideoxy-beta-L-altropyranose hydrolase [Flexivirga endophytica]